MPLDRRVQLLLDEERHERLLERSRRTGASVNALIREAIDVAYPPAPTDRERWEAGERLLAAEPMPVPETYEELKEELIEAHLGRISLEILREEEEARRRAG